MDATFVLLLTFLFNSQPNYRFGVVSADQENSQVISDEWYVEKIAVHRASCKRKFFSFITKPFQIGKKTICNRSPDVKAAFCSQILPMTEYDLKIAPWYDDPLKCTRETFYIRHVQEQKPDHFKLKMYSCPSFRYRDLETERDTAIDEKYYVSKGHERNSALVFRRLVADSKIYPVKHFKNIDFNQLVPPDKPRTFESEIEQIRLVRTQFLIDSAVTDFGDTIKKLKTYEKFGRTFSSINVCGLRKSQKIFVCRHSIRSSISDYGPLLLDGYDEYRCRKNVIRIRLPDQEEDATDKKKKKKDVAKDEMKIMESIGEEDEENFDETNPNADSDEAEEKDEITIWSESREDRRARRRKEKERRRRRYRYVQLSLLFCPRRGTLANGDKTVDNFVYLASNTTPSSVTFITRMNRRGSPFVTQHLVRNLSADRIAMDNRRLRLDLYPSEAEHQRRQQKLLRTRLDDFEDWLSYTNGDVQTSVTLARSPAEGLIQFHAIKEEPLIEDILISYSEVRHMKFVYRRFAVMYSSIGICELPHMVKKRICDSIPDIPPQFRWEAGTFSFDEIDRGCFQGKIQLRAREIEKLESKFTMMWYCPEPRLQHTYLTYFIAKSHFKNTVIAFRSASVSNKKDIYTDAALYIQN